MHVRIRGIGPDPLAGCSGKASLLHFCGLIIVNSEKGFRGPVVLKNHIEPSEGIVLTMEEYAKVVEILAQPKCLWPIFS